MVSAILTSEKCAKNLTIHVVNTLTNIFAKVHFDWLPELTILLKDAAGLLRRFLP